MSGNPELLACPFCGSANVAVCDEPSYFVMCNNCYTEGGTANSITGAAKLWNTRATPALPEERADPEFRAETRDDHSEEGDGRLCHMVDRYDDAIGSEVIAECVSQGWAERVAAALNGQPAPIASLPDEEAVERPTFTLAVTIKNDEVDTQVDFQRDPEKWTVVRDAILAGIERLKGMIAEQNGCPARPKLKEHWPVEIPLTNERGELVMVRAKERGGNDFLFTIQVLGPNPISLHTTAYEARAISEAIQRELSRDTASLPSRDGLREVLEAIERRHGWCKNRCKACDAVRAALRASLTNGKTACDDPACVLRGKLHPTPYCVPAASLSPGYVVVPIEPTPEMIEAAAKAELPQGDFAEVIVAEWTAMIAASPKLGDPS